MVQPQENVSRNIFWIRKLILIWRNYVENSWSWDLRGLEWNLSKWKINLLCSNSPTSNYTRSGNTDGKRVAWGKVAWLTQQNFRPASEAEQQQINKHYNLQHRNNLGLLDFIFGRPGFGLDFLRLWINQASLKGKNPSLLKWVTVILRNLW